MTCPALFLTPPHAVSARAGGLQICTREYLQTFRSAGVESTVLTIEQDSRLVTRAWRRMQCDPYVGQWTESALPAVVSAVQDLATRLVLINVVNLAPLAGALRTKLPRDVRIVLLSHGLESVDYLHQIPRGARSRRYWRGLGRRLVAEREHRTSIDHVFCLTTVEAELERWLGARQVTPLPRTIPWRSPLAWTPQDGRLGFVGTLDHLPTRDGLDQFLTALASIASAGVRVRIVGAPERVGRTLASRCASVDYLGPLDDEALQQEASTWSAFVHPMFCFARGCSTKLGVVLSWQLPLVTTPAGARGYTWREGVLPMADSPEGFARLACELARPDNARRVRDDVATVVRSSPSVDEVGALISTALGLTTRPVPL